MRKIFNICILFAVAAGFIACSDDNDAGSSYLRKNPVNVVSSKLFFSAAAQKGGVKFTAPAGSTVSVSDSWATAQLLNDSVVVSVANNPAVDSRSAVLTIKNGNDSTNLPILQSGAIFKYKGAKNIVVSDKDTTLTLPYSKVGAEPALVLADSADASAVSSVEDKDSAFVAHINANSTGEVRTFLLVLKNQEQRDTITVTQGSIDDFDGKTYSLYGYDLLKMTSSTTDINSLVTQFVGTFKKESDTKLSFASDDTGLRMLFYFDPADLSLTLKGGEYILSQTKDNTSYRYRTAFWDIKHYAVLMNLIQQQTAAHNAGKVSDDDFAKFQSMVTAIYDIYASPNLSMTARMTYSKEDGMVAGLLESNAASAAYIQSYNALGKLGFPIGSFNGNALAIYKYAQQGRTQVFNNVSYILQPVMLFHPLSTSAKPAAFLKKR